MTMKSLKKIKWYAVIAASALFVVFAPGLMKDDYLLTVLCNAMISAIAVFGLSIMLGMGGQVTFSTSGMMGIGAFTSGALTTKLGLHPLVGLAASLLIVCVFSLLIGLVLFRLKGTYFAFATIALVQIVYVVLQNWKPVTGGAEGMPGIPPFDIGFMLVDNTHKYFYVIFTLTLICGLIVHRIRTSSLGRSLSSVRDNEIAAYCLGVNVFRTKVISFVISGAFAALAGSLYAHLNFYLSAESFTFEQSGIYLIMVMLGGVSSTVGAFFGAVLLTILPELMRFLQTYYKLVYGIGVIVIMVFMPQGIAGMVKHALYVMTHRRKAAAAIAVAEGPANVRVSLNDALAGKEPEKPPYTVDGPFEDTTGKAN